MFRFVRTAALTMAGIGAVAGWVALAEAQQVQAPSQPAQGEDDDRKAPPGKRAPKPAKGKAAKDDAGAAPIDAETTLDKARRALADGKPETAFGLADQVIKLAKKDPRNTARALGVRGEAHLRQGRPAEALADLESALWVKGGLTGAEREAAVTARTNALQQSGLASAATSPNATRQATDRGQSATHQSGDNASRSASASAPPSTAPTASGGGIGGFFSNLFGGGGGKPQSEASQAPAATAAARPVEPALSSWEVQRTPEPARRPPAAAPARTPQVSTAVAAPAATASASGSAYRIQLAAVRSRSEAEAMAQAVRKDEAAALASRTFEIVEETYGNMGRFYRVRIGEFAGPTEATAICASLRQKQVDCMMLAQ